MKVLVTFFVALSFFGPKSRAQNPDFFIADSVEIVAISDSLPHITMAVEPVVLAVSIVTFSYLLVGCRSYEINGKKYFAASVVKPYFQDSPDTGELMRLYRRNALGRVVWYSTATAGLVFTFTGLVYGFKSFFDNSYYAVANKNYLMGTGLSVVALVARILSFKNLTKAVDLYNFKAKGPGGTKALQLGLSSQNLLGATLSLKF